MNDFYVVSGHTSAGKFRSFGVGADSVYHAEKRARSKLKYIIRTEIVRDE